MLYPFDSLRSLRVTAFLRAFRVERRSPSRNLPFRCRSRAKSSKEGALRRLICRTRLPLRVTAFLWVFRVEPSAVEAKCFRYKKSSLFNLIRKRTPKCPFFKYSYLSFLLISFMPPMYGCSGSGILTEPSSCSRFSRNAINILGGATTVLFSVCAR